MNMERKKKKMPKSKRNAGLFICRLLDNFEQSRRVSLSAMSFRPILCVCPLISVQFPQDGFSWNLIYKILLRKSTKKIHICLISDQYIG